jgi:hypothetical protein
VQPAAGVWLVRPLAGGWRLAVAEADNYVNVIGVFNVKTAESGSY